MDRSESIVELAAAFAKAQATIEAAKKDALNPAFKSNYADLGEVWRVVRAAFAPVGLSVIQMPETGPEGTMTLTTTLLHKSGEWLAGTMRVRLAKDDPQGVGSGLTYARRYALAGLCGVVAEADDDGEAAMGRGAGHAKAQAAPAAAKVAPATVPVRLPKAPKDEITASILKLQDQLVADCGIAKAELVEKTASLRVDITEGRAGKLKDLTGDEADKLEEGLTAWAVAKAAAEAAPAADPEDPFDDDSEYAKAPEEAE